MTSEQYKNLRARHIDGPTLIQISMMFESEEELARTIAWEKEETELYAQRKADFEAHILKVTGMTMKFD